MSRDLPSGYREGLAQTGREVLVWLVSAAVFGVFFWLFFHAASRVVQ